jgi:hypothetical protein
MDHAETVAKLILEAAFPGANMEFRSEQSNGEYDFDLHYPNGKVAAVEATASVDRIGRWKLDLLYGRKKGGWPFDAVLCKKSWHIFLSPAAQIKVVRERADKYLAELEVQELENFSCTDSMCDSIECVQRICNDLSLTGGVGYSTNETKQKITPVLGGGGSFNEFTVIEAWEREAQKPDNLKKLRAAKTDERHLVVYVDMIGLPYIALTSFAPPSVLPNLPVGITHAWLVSEHQKTDLFVVWHGSKTQPWRRMIIPAEDNTAGADISTLLLSQ